MADAVRQVEHQRTKITIVDAPVLGDLPIQEHVDVADPAVTQHDDHPAGRLLDVVGSDNRHQSVSGGGDIDTGAGDVSRHEIVEQPGRGGDTYAHPLDHERSLVRACAGPHPRIR